MRRQRKNILLYGYFGMRNTGDEAILYTFIRQFKRFKKEADYHLYLLIPSIGDLSYSPCFGSILLLPHYKQQILKNWGIARGISRMDYLIFGGGGIIQDHENYRWRAIFSLLKRAMVVKLCGGRIMLVGIGANPLETKIGRFMTKLLCSISFFISVRDEESKKILLGLGIRSEKIKVTADIVPSMINILPDKTESAHKDFDHRRIVVSVLPYHKEKKFNTHFIQNFRHELANSLDELIENKKVRIEFITMQGDNQINDQEEADAIRDLMKCPSAVNIHPFYDNPIDTYRFIQQADLVIGMRLHAIIFAYLAKIPSIAIAYHSKVVNFCQQVGIEDSVIEFLKFNQKEFFKGYNRISQKIEINGKGLLFSNEYYNKLINGSQKNFDFIKNKIN